MGLPGLRSTLPVRERAAAFDAAERFILCIGAQKAGTTWLSRLLSGHPRVNAPWQKEFHYWNTIRPPHEDRILGMAQERRAALGWRAPLRRMRGLLRGERGRTAENVRLYCRMLETPSPDHAEYKAMLMPEDGADLLPIDVTPEYALLSRETLAEIRDLHPDIRFVFVMRDPVSRLWSGVSYNHRHLLADGEVDEDDVVAKFVELIGLPVDAPNRKQLHFSDYAATVTELEAVVPRESIHYMFYEDMFGQERVDELFRFLDLEPIPARFDERTNVGRRTGAKPDRAAMERARRTFAPVYEFVANRFEGQVPEAWFAGGAQGDAA